MRQFRTAAAAAAAVFAIFVASGAKATTVYMDVTYTGLATGVDNYGLFGTLGTAASYTNTQFTSHYYFDSDGNVGSLTINGHSIDVFPFYDEVIPGYARRDAGGFALPPSFVPGWAFGYLSNTLASSQTPQDRFTAYSATGTNDPALGDGWDNFWVEVHDLALGGYFVTAFDLSPQTVTVGTMFNDGSVVFGGKGPVPEPGSWTMMIFGLGTIGAFARSRCRVAAAS